MDPKSIFDLIAHGNLTKHKRPSPEIYEWSLEKLRLPPQSCIAIEDSPKRFTISKNANLNVVTPSIFTRDEKFSDADVVVSDLGEIKAPLKE